MTGMWKAGAVIDSWACITETSYLASEVKNSRGKANVTQNAWHISYFQRV